MVTRYDVRSREDGYTPHYASDDGEFVTHADYKALEADNQGLRYKCDTLQGEIDNLTAELAECRKDAERLNALEAIVKRAYMHGVSFDRIPSYEGEPGGYRFMRRGYISEPEISLRKVIDNAIARSK